MKKRSLLLLGILIGCLLFTGCGKGKVDTNELNEGINGLLSNLPEDKNEFEGNNSENSELKEDLNYSEYIEELVSEGKLTREEADKLIEEQALNNKTSDDLIFPEINFSFDDYNTSTINKEADIYGLHWYVDCMEPCYTSLGLNNPAVMMQTYFRWNTDAERDEHNTTFVKLIKQLKFDFGKVIAGTNYQFSKISDFSKDNDYAVMIFNGADIVIAVSVQYLEADNVPQGSQIDYSKAVAVNVYYASKNEYHDSRGSDAAILNYIEDNTDIGFKWYIEDKNHPSGFYTIDRSDMSSIDINFY